MKLDILQSMGHPWYQWLKSEFTEQYMVTIGKYLACAPELCPKAEDLFTAYRLCPPEKVKVIILGQDPYPTLDHAHGLAFSSRTNQETESLSQIFAELNHEKLGKREMYRLDDWAMQGVFLLNTCLSTTAGISKYHDNIGWARFIKKTLAHVLAGNFHHKQPLVLMLWGTYAKEFVRSYLVDYLRPEHLVLESCHPAAVSWSGGNIQFVGNNHFAKANRWLYQHNIKEIEWNSKEWISRIQL